MSGNLFVDWTSTSCVTVTEYDSSGVTSLGRFGEWGGAAREDPSSPLSKMTDKRNPAGVDMRFGGADSSS